MCVISMHAPRDRRVGACRPVREPRLVARSAASPAVLRLPRRRRADRDGPEGGGRRDCAAARDAHRATVSAASVRSGTDSSSAPAGAPRSWSAAASASRRCRWRPRRPRALGMRVTWVHGARTAEELCSESDGDDVDLGDRRRLARLRRGRRSRRPRTPTWSWPAGPTECSPLSRRDGRKRRSRSRPTWAAARACAWAARSRWCAADTTARAKRVRSIARPTSTGRRSRRTLPTP